MKSLTPEQEQLLLSLSQRFFEVVPLNLRQHCSLTSRIACAVLQHFSIDAQLQPCQLWYAAADRNIVIGFSDHPPAPHRWNGHVVCSAGNWFMDAAIHAFKIEFGLDVPSVATVKKFAIPSQAIGCLDLSERARLWWLQPPAGIDSTPSIEPEVMVQQYAAALIGRLTPS